MYGLVILFLILFIHRTIESGNEQNRIGFLKVILQIKASDIFRGKILFCLIKVVNFGLMT